MVTMSSGWIASQFLAWFQQLHGSSTASPLSGYKHEQVAAPFKSHAHRHGQMLASSLAQAHLLHECTRT